MAARRGNSAPPIRVEILDEGDELHMGAPSYRVRLSGRWVPFHQRGDFQGLWAWSADQVHLALAFWEVRGDWPGTRVVMIDCARQQISRSRRYSGALSAIAWKGTFLVVRDWRGRAHRTRPRCQRSSPGRP